MISEGPIDKALNHLEANGFPFIYLFSADNGITGATIEQLIRENMILVDHHDDFQAGGFILGWSIKSITQIGKQYMEERRNAIKSEIEMMDISEAQSFLLKFPYGHPWHQFGQNRLSRLVFLESQTEVAYKEAELVEWKKTNMIARAANTIASMANTLAIVANRIATNANNAAWAAAAIALVSVVWSTAIYFVDKSQANQDEQRFDQIERRVRALEDASPTSSPPVSQKLLPQTLPQNEEAKTPETLASTPRPTATPAPEQPVDK